jgi:hypothetical protein
MLTLIRLWQIGGSPEFTSRIPVQASRLAIRWTLVSVPGPAHRLGHPGHLLFEFSVGWVASRVGRRFFDVRNLVSLAVAWPAYVGGIRRAVSRRGRLVDIDRAVTRS